MDLLKTLVFDYLCQYIEEIASDYFINIRSVYGISYMIDIVKNRAIYEIQGNINNLLNTNVNYGHNSNLAIARWLIKLNKDHASRILYANLRYKALKYNQLVLYNELKHNNSGCICNNGHNNCNVSLQFHAKLKAVCISGNMELLHKYIKKYNHRPICFTDYAIAACKGGNISIFNKILNKDIPPHVLLRCIAAACCNNQLDMVRYLIALPHIQYIPISDWNYLEQMCLGGSIECIECIMALKQNHPVNYDNIMQYACQYGDFYKIKQLVNIYFKSLNNWNVYLSIICTYGHIELFKYIYYSVIATNMQIHDQCDWNEYIKLSFAGKNNIKYWIMDNICSESLDFDKIMEYIYSFNTLCVLKHMCDKGYLKSQYISTVALNCGLKCACINDNLYYATRLIQYGADCLNDALWLACAKRTTNTELINYLVKNGAHVEYGIESAHKYGNLDLIMYLFHMVHG